MADRKSWAEDGRGQWYVGVGVGVGMVLVMGSAWRMLTYRAARWGVLRVRVVVVSVVAVIIVR